MRGFNHGIAGVEVFLGGLNNREESDSSDEEDELNDDDYKKTVN